MFNIITDIADQLHEFRKRFTDAPRLIREYCGLVIEDDYIEKSEAEKTEEDLRKQLEELQGHYDTRGTCLGELRDYLNTGALRGFDDELVLCLIQHLAYCIQKHDPELFLNDHRKVDAAITDLERRLDDLARLQAERSAQPEPEPPTPPPSPAPIQERKSPKPAASSPPVLTRTPKGKALELRFNGIPSESDRAIMKSAGFRWSRKRQAWLAGYSEESLVIASEMAGIDPSSLRTSQDIPPESPKEPSPTIPQATVNPPASPTTPTHKPSIPRGFVI